MGVLASCMNLFHTDGSNSPVSYMYHVYKILGDIIQEARAAGLFAAGGPPVSPDGKPTPGADAKREQYQTRGKGNCLQLP